MPTTYAHWRFGDRCLNTLDPEIQKIIRDHRDLFDIGVHGPDIFFYYNVLKPNKVNEFGTWLHDQPMNTILPMFKKNYQKSEDKDASLAYLLGFLAHFTLDSYCHSYIEIKEETSLAKGECATHGKIESQLDRYFLVKDGYDPIKTSVTTSLHPTKANARVIAELYDQQNEETVYKTVKDQVFYLNLLKDDSSLKRWFLKTVMNAAGKQKYIDLLLQDEEPCCRDANLRLEKYFNKAVEHYPILAENMIAYLNGGDKLDEYFHNHFCQKEDYRTIPVLSYDEELSYKADDFQK